MPSWLEEVYACCAYEGVIKNCVHALKYRSRKHLAKPLGLIMAGCFKEDFSSKRFDLMIPVPLHRRSMLKRGFNQAELLLEQLVANTAKMEVSTGNLTRARNTRSQVGLSKKQRTANITGAFKVNNPGLFIGKNILLIDDVCTTGSTLNECGKALKGAGAAEVSGFVLAHGG
jgi:ComF family protein